MTKPDWTVRQALAAPKTPSGMLSRNFSMQEFVGSDEAVRLRIRNRPGPRAIERGRNSAAGMELVRSALNDEPINVTSWYRSPALNAAIGGSAKSDHMDGDAVDFKCPGFGRPIAICHAIVKAGIKFDQLIEEGTWVHISFAPRMRQQVLTMRNGKYFPGLRPLK